MRRAGAIAWLALTGLAALVLLVGWLVSPAIRHQIPFGHLARALTYDIAIMAPAIRYLRKHPRKAIAMPTPHYVYPCQYPGCLARYDETQDGRTEKTGAVLTGWIYPWDAEAKGELPEQFSGDIPGHEHILNVMHRVEVES